MFFVIYAGMKYVQVVDAAAIQVVKIAHVPMLSLKRINNMEIIIVIAQRKCQYPGEYGPECIACMSEYEYKDNPEFITNAVKENRENGEFDTVEIMRVYVDKKEIDSILYKRPAIKAKVIPNVDEANSMLVHSNSHPLESSFNTLTYSQKWKLWTSQHGLWKCHECEAIMSDRPNRAPPFPGSSVHCGECNAELTRRTGGGQSDPFGWVLIPTPLQQEPMG